MEKLETPLTVILIIGFITYVTLTNCCSDNINSPVLSEGVGNQNCSAITLPETEEVEEELVEEVSDEIDNNEEDLDTTSSLNNDIATEEE